jgi:hypothetical protein
VIDLPVEMVEEDAESDDIVLLSDLELGQSGPSTSSTIIGRPGVQSAEESDIRIVTDEEPSPSVAPASPPVPAADSGSNLRLVVDEQLDVSSDADTQLRIGAEAISAAGSGIDLSGPPIVASAGTSDISLADDMMADDLVLGGEPAGSSGGSRGSKTGDSGTALAVGNLDDDELVIGGSDITLGTADSGISLASPSDSGLSLEEPLQLKPTERASLEAPADDMGLAPLEAASQADSDDDFLLTPMQEVDAEEQDSGSQVIALDSESSFGSDMLGEEAGMAGGMFEESLEAPPLEPLAAAGAAGDLAPSAAAIMPAREAPYSVWNIVSLSFCTLILALAGLLMVDLMRNLWSWGTPYTITSSLADTIVGIIPGMH